MSMLPEDAAKASPEETSGGVAVMEPPAPDAIIYIPGLVRRGGSPTDLVARRIARAFDHNAKTGSAKFSIEDAKEEDYKDIHKSRVISIVRKDGDEKQHIADVYELDYQNALTGAFRRHKPATQALSIAGLLIANFYRLVGAITKRSKTLTEKIQVFYAGLIFIVLAAYVPVLLVGVVATGWDLVQTQLVTPAAENQTRQPAAANQPDQQLAAQEPHWYSKPLRWLQLIVLFVTATGLFTRASLKDFLAETAAHAVPALSYLDYDDRKGLVLGQLNNLLEHLHENSTKYSRIHIIGYSFGSVVALDALFPQHQPSPRLAEISTLTTIGSPFDFMRTYWPDYFTQRRTSEGSKGLRWLNVYSPVDVLGSDFKDTNGQDRGVQLVNAPERMPDSNERFGREQPLSFARPIEYLGLIGFRAHAKYWERDEVFDINCVDIVVRELFATHKALA